MENEIYKKVFIHSESDLPKDENLYIWHEKDSGVIDPLQPLFFAKEIIPYLLQRFDWYLQPVPAPLRREEIMSEVITIQSELLEAYSNEETHPIKYWKEKWDRIMTLKTSLTSQEVEGEKAEIDSDVKVYNERQDLQAKFRQLPAQSPSEITDEVWNAENFPIEFLIDLTGRSTEDIRVNYRVWNQKYLPQSLSRQQDS